jgi:transcriptional regulator with XRE-family HTH domain
VRNETHAEIIEQIQKTTRQEIVKIQRERDETGVTLQQMAKRMRLLEQDTLAHEQRIRQEERQNREEITREKDSRIHALEVQLKESAKQLQTEFQQLREQMIRNTTGSTNKGKDGEAQVEELLKLAFGSAPSFDLNPVCGQQVLRWLRSRKPWVRAVDG